jgi:hypothetical protein
MMRHTLVAAVVGLAFGGLAAAGETAGTVAVIRGADTTTHPSSGVVVMRPPRDSFLRETTRLAAEADAREERAAADRGEDAQRRLAEALESLAITAYATHPGMSDDWMHSHVWVTGSQSIPRRVNKTLAPVAPMRSSPP